MRALNFAAAALALSAAQAASATSIAHMPHQPQFTCGKVAALVRNLNADRLHNENAYLPTFYSDEFGEVERSEEAAFLASLHNSNGRADQRPIEVRSIWVLHREEGIYLVTLRRMAWQLSHLERNDMLLWEEIPDPHYEEQYSTWIATFRGGQQIWEFRQADELFSMYDKVPELDGCEPGHEDIMGLVLPDGEPDQ